MLRGYYDFLSRRAQDSGSSMFRELGSQLIPWAFFACIAAGFSFVMDLSPSERLLLLVPIAAATALGVCFVVGAFVASTLRTSQSRDRN